MSVSTFKTAVILYILYKESCVNHTIQLPMQSVPITTNIVSSSPVHVEVYSIQHYAIKFVSDCDGSVVLSGYSGYLHKLNLPPRYNSNIVDSGVKHHKPNQTKQNRTNILRISITYGWPGSGFLWDWYNPRPRIICNKIVIKHQYSIISIEN